VSDDTEARCAGRLFYRLAAETMGTWEQRWKWVSGSWVNVSDPLHFLFLVDIKKLLTHSIGPSIVIAGGLILIYDFFALKTEIVVQ